jgi:polysaccharide deacetylase family protein (PEP-CTERM system associated)
LYREPVNAAKELSMSQHSGAETVSPWDEIRNCGFASGTSTSTSAFRDLLSVDVEDFFHVEAFAERISQSEWPRFASRVRRNTQRVLELLAEYGQTATFFVLGWIAERDPALMRSIVESGHELACHSYAHRRVFTLSPQEFRDDLRRARIAIEDAGSVAVVGYRAPSFSIRTDSLWALEILAEEGFRYDSSVFPVRHDLYGMPNGPRFPYAHRLAGGNSIVEIPLSTVRLFGVNLGVAGGGYLRHLPMPYTRWGIRRIHFEQQPAHIYFHPWELDPEQPRIAGRARSRLRHYRGLRKTEPRLRALLASQRFGRLIDFVHRSFIVADQKASQPGGLQGVSALAGGRI